MCHRSLKCLICNREAACEQRQAIVVAKMSLGALCLLLFLPSLTLSVLGSYQFPIQQNLLTRQRQSLRAPPPPQVAGRRMSGAGQNAGDEEDSDARQLRQLHQVVDTMAQLLSEEQQQQQQQQQQNQQARSQRSLASDMQRQVNRAHDMMSESEIRRALEELERVQQPERRRNPATSTDSVRPQQKHTMAASSLRPLQEAPKVTSIESLIEELGDEFLDEQMAVASQEALLQQRPNKESQNQDNRGPKMSADGQPASSTPTSNRQSSPSNRSSLFVGQLDSLASELGSDLTNDFYSFQTASSEAERQPGDTLSSDRDQNDAPMQRMQQIATSSTVKLTPATNQLDGSDLEPAAQTRNTAQHEPLEQPNFGQNQGTIRFDFSQPSSHEPLQRPLAVTAQSNSDALARAFKQQMNGIESGFSTSTLLPIVAPDNFWRPSVSSSSHLEGESGDIAQQYNQVARGNQQQQQQNLAPLPASRFQSLSPLGGQFSQPAIPRQQPHIHFTGHSFISSSNPNGPQTQIISPNQQQQATRERPFSPTAPPLISVLSGSDTSNGNSVTWNPPPTISPPASSSIPQVNFKPSASTSTTTQASQTNFNTERSAQQFYPGHSNRAPPSTLFDNAFQEPPRRQASGGLGGSAEEAPSTTEDLFAPPTTTQWAPELSDSPSPPTIERDVSDSQPRSSVRSLSNNQRFFSPNDLIGPTSTLASLNTEPPTRSSRFQPAPTVPTTTTSTSGPQAGSNSTKKDDMVIYYYYYYDDNKNATVVAKNVSSSSTPGSIDSAIEADGGIEDTPYMDDPAPVSNLASISDGRGHSSSTPSTTTSTSTSTTTTTTTTTQASSQPSEYEPNVREDKRLQSASARFPPSTESVGSVRMSQFDRNLLQPITPNSILQGEQQRTPSTRLPPIQMTRKPNQEPANPFTSTPANVPSSTVSFKQASGRHTDTIHEPASRLAGSTESSRPLGGHQTSPSRAELSTLGGRDHGQGATAPSNKIQKDLIQSVLAGQRRPQAGLSQPISTQATTSINGGNGITSSNSASTHNNRAALSNASRYGTNNNLMLDPYGLDPAAPATLTHSSHSSASDGAGSQQHHRNWQQSNSAPTHQFNRKPASSFGSEAHLATGVLSTEGPVVPKSQMQPASSPKPPPAIQHFSPQRNQNQMGAPILNQNPSPTSGSRSAQAGSAGQQSQQPAVSRLSSTSTITSSQAPSRQFFPESNNQLLQQGDRSTNELTLGPQKSPVSRQQSVQGQFQTVQLQQQQPEPAKEQMQFKPEGTRQQQQQQQSEFTGNRLISSSEQADDLVREPAQSRLASGGNGRPASADGNTSNGFTKSPPTQAGQTSSTPVPFASQKLQPDRPNPIGSSPVSSTQSTISTSVSRSFVTPQQVQVTTSVSQPTITSTSTLATVTQGSTAAQSSSQSSSSQAPPSASSSSTPLTPAPPQPTTSSSTSSAPETAGSTTESADAAGASTRKKFGNRNNRFQTRLNSISSSSVRSTTSSTTPAPSTSTTTRRPTTSTTRKSSKQLFAGRRRLSSGQTAEQAASGGNNNGPSFSGTSSISGNSTAGSSGAADSATTGGFAPTRTKFGNTFAARGRSTTAAPNAASSNGNGEPASSSQKPNLFGANQRASSKPRLPFMKANSKPSSEGASEAPAELASGSVQGSNSMEAVTQRAPPEGESAAEGVEGAPVDSSAPIAEEADLASKRDSAAAVAANEQAPNSPAAPTMTASTTTTTTSTSTTTAAPSQAPDAANGIRSKPKVRPLFASRQRSSSLFGNRRSSNSTASAA